MAHNVNNASNDIYNNIDYNINNNENEKECFFEGQAHFSYEDLYKRLWIIKNKQKDTQTRAVSASNQYKVSRNRFEKNIIQSINTIESINSQHKMSYSPLKKHKESISNYFKVKTNNRISHQKGSNIVTHHLMHPNKRNPIQKALIQLKSKQVIINQRMFDRQNIAIRLTNTVVKSRKDLKYLYEEQTFPLLKIKKTQQSNQKLINTSKDYENNHKTLHDNSYKNMLLLKDRSLNYSSLKSRNITNYSRVTFLTNQSKKCVSTNCFKDVKNKTLSKPNETRTKKRQSSSSSSHSWIKQKQQSQYYMNTSYINIKAKKKIIMKSTIYHPPVQPNYHCFKLRNLNSIKHNKYIDINKQQCDLKKLLVIKANNKKGNISISPQKNKMSLQHINSIQDDSSYLKTVNHINKTKMSTTYNSSHNKNTSLSSINTTNNSFINQKIKTVLTKIKHTTDTNKNSKNHHQYEYI